TFVAELKEGTVREYTLNPQQVGLQLHALSSIQVSDAAASKAMILDVLQGKHGAARDIVLLNAGAAIYVAGIERTLQQGIHKAAEVIDNGAARQRLEELVAATASNAHA
ncbi:MAG: anthranilate phosphoribosyltransferase, partial [Methylophilaceae bacterium]